MGDTTRAQTTRCDPVVVVRPGDIASGYRSSTARGYPSTSINDVSLLIVPAVWIDVEHLAAFVYGEMHRQVLRQRRRWFEPMREAYSACWWVPTGQRPTTDEAEGRIRHLRAHGPTPHAFTLHRSYPAPDRASDQPVHGLRDWFCPA